MIDTGENLHRCRVGARPAGDACEPEQIRDGTCAPTSSELFTKFVHGEIAL